MSLNLNLILIALFLILLQISKICEAAATSKETETNDTDVTFLVSGGYRPEKDTLTKYAVRIEWTKPRAGYICCSGTIISKRVILTAACCMTNCPGGGAYTMDTDGKVIVARTPNRLVRTEDSQVISIKDIIIHPKFDSTTDNVDLAILKLVEDIKIDGVLAEIVELPDFPYPTPGMRCTTFGWGGLYRDGPITAVAIYLEVNVIDMKHCVYKGIEGNICVGDLNDLEVGVCNGDAGGPLICELKFVAITSLVNCSDGYPDAYVDVYYHRDWIVRTMEMKNHCCNPARNIALIYFLTIFIIILQ